MTAPGMTIHRSYMESTAIPQQQNQSSRYSNVTATPSSSTLQDTRTASSSIKTSSVKIRKRQHTPYTPTAEISSLNHSEPEISAKRPTFSSSRRPIVKHSTPLQDQDIAPEKTRSSSLRRVRFQQKTEEKTTSSSSVSRGIFKNLTNTDLSSVSPNDQEAGRAVAERDQDIQESYQQENHQEREGEHDGHSDEDMEAISDRLQESVIRGNTDSEASEVEEEDVKPALSQIQAQVEAPSPPAMDFRELLTPTQPTQETQEIVKTVKRRQRIIGNRPDSTSDDNSSKDGSGSDTETEAPGIAPTTPLIIKKAASRSRSMQLQSPSSQIEEPKSQQMASEKSGSDTDKPLSPQTPQIIKKAAAKQRRSRGQSSPKEFHIQPDSCEDDGSETETEAPSPMKTPVIKKKPRESLRRYQTAKSTQSTGDIRIEPSPTQEIVKKSGRRRTRNIAESSDSANEGTLEEQSATDEDSPMLSQQDLPEPMDMAQDSEEKEAGHSSVEASEDEGRKILESVSLERIKKMPGGGPSRPSVSSETDQDQAEEEEPESDAPLPSLETVDSPPSYDVHLEQERMTSFLNDSILLAGSQEMRPERAEGARQKALVDPLVQLRTQTHNRSASQEYVEKETGFTLESPSIDQASSVGELKIVESESGRSDKENYPPSENDDKIMRTPSAFTRAKGIRRKKASQKTPARESILSSDRPAQQAAQTPSTVVQGTSSSSQSPATSHKRTRSFRRKTEVVKDPKEMPTPTPARRRLKPVEENDELSIGYSDNKMQVDVKPKGLVAINHVEVIHESASQMSCDSEPQSSASVYQSPQAGSQSSSSSVDYMTPDENEEELEDDHKSVRTFTSSTLNVSNSTHVSSFSSRAVNISRNTAAKSAHTFTSGSHRGRTITEEDSEDYGSDAGNSSFQAMTGIAPVASSEYLSVGTICSPPARNPQGRNGF